MYNIYARKVAVSLFQVHSRQTTTTTNTITAVTMRTAVTSASGVCTFSVRHNTDICNDFIASFSIILLHGVTTTTVVATAGEHL